MNNEDVDNIFQKCFFSVCFFFFLTEQQLLGDIETNMYASQCFS